MDLRLSVKLSDRLGHCSGSNGEVSVRGRETDEATVVEGHLTVSDRIRRGGVVYVRRKCHSTDEN
jgi:hypothetical protein